jgi:hypothetical protein
MTDQQANNETETESEADIELRRQIRIQQDELQKIARDRRATELGKMTNEELNKFTRQFGFDAV